MAFKKPFKITVSNLTEKTKDDPEMQDRLVTKKVEIDCLSGDATRLVRLANVAVAQAQIALAKKAMGIQEFLSLASEVDETIAREESAMAPYTNGKGDICVDIPFTQREQRAAIRAAHKNLAKAVEDDDVADDDLFEHGEEDQH